MAILRCPSETSVRRHLSDQAPPNKKERMNSIDKGKRGEREVAKLLSAITSATWARVPSSGALFTSQGKEMFAGDVYTDHRDFGDVTIEVKNQNVVVSVNEILNKKSVLHTWISQLKRECGSNLGILFFKNKGKWVWYIYRPGGIIVQTRFVNKLKGVSSCYHDFGIVNGT